MSADASAHSAEDASFIGGLLRAWRLSEPVTVTPLPNQGQTSRVWSVAASGESFVAKLIYDGRRYAEPGLRVAAAVEKGGVPTGAPLPTRGGDVSIDVPVGDRVGTLALLRFVPGQPLDPRSPEAPQIAGALLGRVHAILLRDSTRSWVPADLLEWAKWWASTSPAVDRPRAAAALRKLESLGRRGRLTTAVVYGDPSPEILVEEQSGVAALIDWGTPSWGPLLHDIACWTTFTGADSPSSRKDAFFRAYRRSVQLDDAEVDALPVLHDLGGALRFNSVV